MSVRFQCLGSASSGCTLSISLTSNSVEALTQNLDWIVVLNYPAIRADKSWRYYSDALPTFVAGDRAPNSGSKISYSISRKILHYAEQPRRVVESSKVVINLNRLVKANTFTLFLQDVWFANSSINVDVPVTKFLSESKVLFTIKVGYTTGGLEWNLVYARYGNSTAQRDRDITQFMNSEVIMEGPLV